MSRSHKPTIASINTSASRGRTTQRRRDVRRADLLPSTSPSREPPTHLATRRPVQRNAERVQQLCNGSAVLRHKRLEEDELRADKVIAAPNRIDEARQVCGGGELCLTIPIVWEKIPQKERVR